MLPTSPDDSINCGSRSSSLWLPHAATSVSSRLMSSALRCESMSSVLSQSGECRPRGLEEVLDKSFEVARAKFIVQGACDKVSHELRLLRSTTPKHVSLTPSCSLTTQSSQTDRRNWRYTTLVMLQAWFGQYEVSFRARHGKCVYRHSHSAYVQISCFGQWFVLHFSLCLTTMHMVAQLLLSRLSQLMVRSERSFAALNERHACRW